MFHYLWGGAKFTRRCLVHKPQFLKRQVSQSGSKPGSMCYHCVLFYPLNVGQSAFVLVILPTVVLVRTLCETYQKQCSCDDFQNQKVNLFFIFFFNLNRADSYDRNLVHAIETVIIEWTHQIRDVLKRDSAQPVLEGLNPTPFVEIKFWENKTQNLECIYEQVSTPEDGIWLPKWRRY